MEEKGKRGSCGCFVMNNSNLLWGDSSAPVRFLQPTDRQDLSRMEEQVEALKKLTSRRDWCLLALPVECWNRDLSPWCAPPVFGKEGFGDGARQTLDGLLSLLACDETSRAEILCGYSLAGLFALWAAYQTDRFDGVVAASPSVWFPGWTAYAAERAILTPRVYLSLGDREEKTKNPVMATVGSVLREQYRLLSSAGVTCQLDRNPGNHFVDSALRTAKGMAWMLEHLPTA